MRLWTVAIGDVPHHRALALLSADERARAASLTSDTVRQRFAAARATLRAALGEAAGADPASLRITEGEHGKPELADGGPLRFNVSHSGGLALVAVAAGRELGVDVERVRPRVRLDAIARRCFSAAERGALARAAGDDRVALFHAIWTAREAFVKATGRGLAAAADSFEVPAWPEGTREPVAVAEAGRPEPRFSLLRLAPGEGYTGALVAGGEGWRVVRCTLPATLGPA